MNLNEMARSSKQCKADASVEPGDRSAWESYSAEQLREILDRGLAAGDAFTFAAAEIERRAGEVARRAREFSSGVYETRHRRARLAKLAALAIFVASAAAFAIYWLAY
jgi:hypothetical protein